jgi:hypothetical protein
VGDAEQGSRVICQEAALAKLFGVRPYHDRWDSRNIRRSEPAA